MDNKIIYLILEKVGPCKELETSTGKLAKQLSVSQQTVSRKLRELEARDLIQRTVSPTGIKIRLKDKALSFLKSRHNLLKKVFEKRKPVFGTVTGGIGEGKYYINIYKEKFEINLNFKPFLGTLNIKVNPAKSREFILNSEDIYIKEFSDGSRTFGGVHCYMVKINDKIEGALIVPVRARHPDDINEIIAPVYLREVLKLKNGDKIKISW